MAEFKKQKVTRRYGLLRGPSSSSWGELWPSAGAFSSSFEQKMLLILFWPTLYHVLVFSCSHSTQLVLTGNEVLGCCNGDWFSSHHFKVQITSKLYFMDLKLSWAVVVRFLHFKIENPS